MFLPAFLLNKTKKHISKGILTKETDDHCFVFHRGTEYSLNRLESELWKAGRDRLCESDCILTLEDMEETGLISIAEDNSIKSIQLNSL